MDGIATTLYRGYSIISGDRLYVERANNVWINKYQEWWPMTASGMWLYNLRDSIIEGQKFVWNK